MTARRTAQVIIPLPNNLRPNSVPAIYQAANALDELGDVKLRLNGPHFAGYRDQHVFDSQVYEAPVGHRLAIYEAEYAYEAAK